MSLAGAALLPATKPSLSAESDIQALLTQALNAEHRSAANRARDRYRHPKETLQFLGLQPWMTVVEVWPSSGWWTEILAPLLAERGKYYAAYYATEWADTPEYMKAREKAFDDMVAANPAVYGKLIKTKLLAPQFVDIAPAGSADMVLTFRNVHNWAKAGNAQAMFDAFFVALKSRGVLGVKDHRAKSGTSLAEQIKSGYLTEDYVIEVARKAGFELAEKSEVNANPLDTKDYPEGVWTLPPTLRMKEKDRDKYLAIGESDRMTLKFVKP